jgi:SAM-dependent methyltransferase
MLLARLLRQATAADARCESLANAAREYDQSDKSKQDDDLFSHRQLVNHLTRIPSWQDKIRFHKEFVYNQPAGVWARGRRLANNLPTVEPYAKVHYGCGPVLLDGWLNVDELPSDAAGYMIVNLLEKHPFPNNSVQFGYAQDVLEHFDQAQSMFFLSEVCRTLSPGGVMRLSFPGLEGVLLKHYSPPTEANVRTGEIDAYSVWDHLHFYSNGELELVSKHLGFSGFRLVNFGQSEHPELRNLDTRTEQLGLNTYAELTK